MNKQQKNKIEKIRQSTIVLTGIIIILYILYIIIGGIITPPHEYTYTDELNHHSQTVYHKDYIQLNNTEQEHIHELKKDKTQEFPQIKKDKSI